MFPSNETTIKVSITHPFGLTCFNPFYLIRWFLKKALRIGVLMLGRHPRYKSLAAVPRCLCSCKPAPVRQKHRPGPPSDGNVGFCRELHPKKKSRAMLQCKKKQFKNHFENQWIRSHFFWVSFLRSQFRDWKAANKINKYHWLVVYLPLWKMMEFVRWDYEIPSIWQHKIHVPNYQPVSVWHLWLKP